MAAGINIPITYSIESLDQIAKSLDGIIAKRNIGDLFIADQNKIKNTFAIIKQQMEEQLKTGGIDVSEIDFTKAQKAIEKFALKVAYVLDEAFDQDTQPLIKKITAITDEIVQAQKKLNVLKTDFDSLTIGSNTKIEEFKKTFGVSKLPLKEIVEVESEIATLEQKIADAPEKGKGSNTSAMEKKLEKAKALLDILKEIKLLEEIQVDISEKELDIKDLTKDKEEQEIKYKEVKDTMGSESTNVSQEILETSKELNDVKEDGRKIEKDLGTTIKETTKIKKDSNDEDDNGKQGLIQKASAVLSYTFLMSNLRKALNESLKAVREIDKAMTEAAIVTNLNRQEAYKLLGAYQDLARKTGLATSEIGAIVVEFLKQGRGIKDAMELAEVAAKAAKVAGINANDAVDYLTAAVNGFGLAVSKAEDIADKFSAIAAASASDFQELAIAMSKVAPVAKTSGVGVDFMMGVLAKGLETTREAPENIGTAFKTIFARMREITDIGRATEDGMGLNRVENALQSIGVTLRDSTGQFRNLEDVLVDVGNKWDTLSSIEQAYIATSLAGTRQQPRLLAIFNDFARTKELIQISTDAVGGLANQHREYMQGAEAALAGLKTSWEGFIMTFTDSDLIVGLIQLVTGLMNAFNSLIGMIGNSATINMAALVALGFAFGNLLVQQVNLQRVKAMDIQQDAVLLAYAKQKISIGEQERKLIEEKISAINTLKATLENANQTEKDQALQRIALLQEEIVAVGQLNVVVNQPPKTSNFLESFLKSVSKGKADLDKFEIDLNNLHNTVKKPSAWSSFSSFVGKSTGALIAQAGQMLINIALMTVLSVGIGLLIGLLSGLVSWAWEGFMDMAGGADHFSKKVSEINVKLDDLGDKEKSIQKLIKRLDELNKNAFKSATEFDELLDIIEELEAVEFKDKKYNLTRTDITGRVVVDEAEYKKLQELIEDERTKLLNTRIKSFMTSLKNDFSKTLQDSELMDVAKMIGYDFGLKFIDSFKDSIDDNLKDQLKGVAARLSDLINLTDFQEKTWRMTNIIPDWLGGNYFRFVVPLYIEEYSPEELREMMEEYTETVLGIFKTEFEKYNDEIQRISSSLELTPQKKTEDIFLAGAEAYRAAEAELRRTIKDPADLQVAIQLLTESMQDEKLLNELINNRKISVEVVAQMSLDLDLAAIKKLFDNLKKEVQELMNFTIYGNFLQNRDNNSDFGNALREWFASTGRNIDDFAESIFDNLFSKTATGISEGFDDLSDFYQLAVEAGTMTAEEAQKALMAVANSIDKFSISELATKLQDDMKLAKNAFNLYKDIAKGELGTFAQIVETFGVGAAKQLMSGDISSVTEFFDKQNAETIKQIENSIEIIRRAAQEREELGGVGLTTAENQEIEGLEIMIEYYEEIAIQEQLRNYRLQKASELLKEMNNLLSLQQKLADLGIGGPLIDMLDQIADQSYTEGLNSFMNQFDADIGELIDPNNQYTVVGEDGMIYFNPDEMGRGQALVENVLNSFTQLIDGVTAAYNRQKKEIEQRYKAEQDAIKTSHADRWSQIDYVNTLAEAENKIIEGRRRLAGLVLSGISRGTLEQAQKDLKKLQEERQKIIEEQMVDKATKEIEKQMDEELIAVQQELTSVLDRLIATMETYTNVLTETTDPGMPPGTSSNATGDGTSGSNYTRTVTLQARQLDATEDLVDRTEELNITSGLLKANILDLSSKTFDLTSSIAAVGIDIGSSIAESGLLDANYDLISSLSKLSGIIQDGIVLKETNGGSTTVPVDTTAIDGIPNQ
jgi:TP901 family phage tail tape measure protein